jgi:hypothetical protein
VVAVKVAAYFALIVIRYIMTGAAKFYFASHSGNSFTQKLYLFVVLFQQMQHQAQGGFLTYTRQFGKLGNSIGYEFG